MIDKKELIIAVLATFCLTAALFMVVPTRSQTGSYDARTDVNGDGTIDMADISMGVEGFMTNGDPTLNVNVANWPNSSDVPVWWDHDLPDGGETASPTQHSQGFSRLHILVRIFGLSAAETVDFGVYGRLYNAAHTVYYSIGAYTETFTYTNYYSDISMDVPSESFQFYFHAADGTICTVFLSYYLTWA